MLQGPVSESGAEGEREGGLRRNEKESFFTSQRGVPPGVVGSSEITSFSKPFYPFYPKYRIGI